ncbi:MAG: hypothetical protein HYU67_10305 [Flavobacteriia bacterium]|nr:hypothetical protein [Flavobacteriia bacterium]
MKYYFLLLLTSIILFSCKEDKLKPSTLKKVILLEIDYLKNKFEGGKEFSYFTDNSQGSDLPIIVKEYINNTSKRITFLYGDKADTIFDATEIVDGQGEILYPNNFDSYIFYYKLDSYTVSQPSEDFFQILYHDSSDPIPFDSIWKTVSNLKTVESYRNKNPSSKIGLILIRPSLVTQNPGDWKWLLILRE